MSKQHRQNLPHALRVGTGTPEQAMLSLLSAIGHRHPREAGESEQQWKARLRAVAVELIRSEGAILVYSDNDKETLND